MPVALVDKNLVRNSAAARAAASYFLQYLWEPACQQDFADCGFRCKPSTACCQWCPFAAVWMPLALIGHESEGLPAGVALRQA